MYYYGKNFSLVEHELRGSKSIFTFDVKPDLLDRIFEWTRNHQRKFIGEGQVWHTYPDCKPCSTEFAELLYKEWIRIKGVLG